MEDNAAFTAFQIVTIILGLVLTGASIFVAIAAIRIAHPRKQLQYAFTVTPLLKLSLQGFNKLSVAFDGEPITQPYIAIFYLEATGRTDVSSNSFDAGKPFEASFNTPIVSVISQSHDPSTVDYDITNTGTSLQLKPALLPRGFRIEVVCLCEGRPSLAIKHSLANVDVRREGEVRGWLERVVQFLRKLFLPVFSMAAGLVAIVVVEFFFLRL